MHPDSFADKLCSSTHLPLTPCDKMTEPIHPDTCEQQQPRGSRVLKAAPQRDKWNAGVTQDLLSQGEMASNTAKEAGTLAELNSPSLLLACKPWAFQFTLLNLNSLNCNVTEDIIHSLGIPACPQTLWPLWDKPAWGWGMAQSWAKDCTMGKRRSTHNVQARMPILLQHLWVSTKQPGSDALPTSTQVRRR